MNDITLYISWLKKTVHILKDIVSGLPFAENKQVLPQKSQHDVLLGIINNQANTLFGRQHNFSGIHSLKDFQHNVPLSYAKDYLPYFEKIRKGEINVLFREPLIAWTLNPDNNKDFPFPLTCAMAGKIVSTLHSHFQLFKKRHEKAGQIHKGKGLLVTKNAETSEINGVPTGYLDGILLNLFINSDFRKQHIIPIHEHTKQNSGDKKMHEIAKASIHEDVKYIAGYGNLILNLLAEIQREHKPDLANGSSTINDIWPNLKCIFVFDSTSNNCKLKLASYVGPSTEILMAYYMHGPGLLGYETKGDETFLPFFNLNFYEFIPFEDWMNDSPEDLRHTKHGTLLFPDLKDGSEYVIAITTSGGLYRYVTQIAVRYSSGKLHRVKKLNIADYDVFCSFFEYE